MLTYQICPWVEPPKPRPKVELNLLTKAQILDNHLRKMIFMTGDRVVFKKPRGKFYGTITHIERDLELVTWSSGGYLPANITVKLDGGAVIKTAYKRIKLIGKG